MEPSGKVWIGLAWGASRLARPGHPLTSQATQPAQAAPRLSGMPGGGLGRVPSGAPWAVEGAEEEKCQEA